MPDARPARKFRVRYVVLVVAGLLTVGIVLFWQNIKYHFVRRQIGQAVTEKSGGLYRLSYEDLLIDEVGGNISVRDVHLSTDSVIYEKMRREKSRAPVRIDIFIPSLEIRGVATPKALLNQQITGNSLLIPSARIDISLPPAAKEAVDSETHQNLPQMIYEQVLGTIKQIRLDTLRLEKIDFRLSDAATGRQRFAGAGFSCDLSRILIDSAHLYDSSRIFFAENILLRCRNLTLPAKNKKYDFHFGALEYDSRLGRFRAGLVSMEPRLGEDAFAATSKFSTDRFDFRLSGIEINGLQRLPLLRQQIVADSVSIAQSRLKIYRDISRPHDSVDRTNAYPQVALMKIPLPFSIRAIRLADNYTEYKEKNAKSDSSGRVAFYAVSATLRNVTNMPSFIQRDNRMVLDFRSRFLNKARFHAVITMFLKDPADRFSVHATLGPMTATDLNPLIVPMGLARIDRGQIDGLDYRLSADRLHAKGHLAFLYKDIKIALLKKDKGEDGFKKRWLPTLAAGVLVKDSNPSGGNTRTTEVDFKRDRTRSIFNLMWKSMFSGIKKIAGM